MNQLRLVSIAAMLVAAAGSSQALTPAQIEAARTAGTLKEIRIAGASALRLSVAAYMKEICASNSFHVFWNSNSEGTDHRAYSCNLAVAQGNFPVGTPVLVYKRDAGGSGQGVNPIATAADQTHMKVDTVSCATTISATPGGDAAVPNYICGATETAGIKSDAGISDVEPALLQAPVNLPGTTALTPSQLATLDVGPLAQALFAVAVNTKAYRALQEAQGIIAPGGALIDVPADQSTWTDATLATIPSVPSNWVRAVLTGQAIGGGAKRGWSVVIPDTAYTLNGAQRPAVDVNANAKTLNICRRTEGSGTQAISNAFFANNPCGTGAAAFTPLNVAGSAGNATTVAATVFGSILVQEGTSAGQVENCVGTDANSAVSNNASFPGDNTAYAIAFLGREANPLRAGGDLGYRYVKLDGVAPVRNEARNGRYAVVYEATMQWNRNTVPPGSDKDAFLRALRTGFGSPNGLAAVDSDTQQGVMSPPAAYSGTFADATGNAALFGSRVGRLAGNSCAPLRTIK
ncbi:MAG: hypothetical protein MUF03_11965 [Rubrivivax sp.]|jgi:hypothetical protein|nr:hypothetical protein [Rubrivivax sp.]